MLLLRELIAQYRASNNLSQRAFAAKCDVTNGYISMLENGKNPATGKPVVPSLTKLSKIAEGMEMNLQQLLQLADDMEVDIGSTEVCEHLESPSPAALRLATIYDTTSDQGRELFDSIAVFVEKTF